MTVLDRIHNFRPEENFALSTGTGTQYYSPFFFFGSARPVGKFISLLPMQLVGNSSLICRLGACLGLSVFACPCLGSEPTFYNFVVFINN